MKIFGDPGELTENDSVLEVKEKVLHGFRKKKEATERILGYVEEDICQADVVKEYKNSIRLILLEKH